MDILSYWVALHRPQGITPVQFLDGEIPGMECGGVRKSPLLHGPPRCAAAQCLGRRFWGPELGRGACPLFRLRGKKHPAGGGPELATAQRG